MILKFFLVHEIVHNVTYIINIRNQAWSPNFEVTERAFHLVSLSMRSELCLTLVN